MKTYEIWAFNTENAKQEERFRVEAYSIEDALEEAFSNLSDKDDFWEIAGITLVE